jgi:hypothetical protein
MPCVAATVRAVFHLIPDFFPLFPPNEGQAAVLANLGWKIGFFAHFHLEIQW